MTTQLMLHTADGFVMVPITNRVTVDCDGGTSQPLHVRVRVDDNYVQAQCMHLERLGRGQEADALLEEWCSGH